MSPLEQVTVVMTLMRRLQNLVEEETEILRMMKLERVAALQDEKTALGEAYEIEMYNLRKNPEILGSLDIAVRRELEHAVLDLREASRRNAHAVDAARSVVDRIVQRLGRVVEQRNSAPAGYDRSGQNRVIPVAFNHSI
ncbi:MAG: hypothetical protein R3C97_02620 [Geminicoccaceae bacterium]